MKQRTILISLLAVALFVFAACGGGGSSSSSSSDGSSASGGDQTGSGAQPTPTVLSGSFVAVGEQSVLTDTANLTVTTETTDTAAAPAVDLAVGERSYTKNKCGDCHGTKGEGVADKGNAIADTTLSFDDFAKVVSTGGGLGKEHIFGRSAVSPTGMQALYAYVQSLK